MRKLLFLFFVILLVTKVGFANQSKVDSLWEDYRNAEHDTTKAKILVEITEHLYLQYPDTMISLCQKAIKIIDQGLPYANIEEKHAFLQTKAAAFNNIGYIYNKRGKIEKALEYYYMSLTIRERNNDELGMANSHNSLGVTYYNAGENKKAIEHFFLSLKICEKFKDNKGKSQSYNNIALIYSHQGEIDSALEFYFLSLRIDEEIEDKEGLAKTYNNIGSIYNNQGIIDKALESYFLSLKILEELNNKNGMAYCYNNIGFILENQGENERALEYHFLSLKLRKQIMDQRGMSASYNCIGFIYDKQGDTDNALDYYLKSLKLREEIDDKRGMAIIYHNYGNLLCKLGKEDEGMRYLELGLALCRKLGYTARISDANSKIGSWKLKFGQVKEALNNGLEALKLAREAEHTEYLKRAARLLSDVYRKQNNFNDALSMYELQIQMRDSIHNEENTKATIRQQMKYDYEKEEIIKEQQTKEEARIEAEATSRRNTLHYTAIFIGMLLVFGLVLALGFVKVNPKTAEAIIFISFLIVFEFLLVVADPYIEDWSGGAPGWKLLFNAVLAGLIFPLHQFFESKLKKRLIKVEKKKRGIGVKSLMIGLKYIMEVISQ
ncbi:MAG: tetratricopeptide repeat protein [Bacteroidia bacterium]|nr:tetratricopeptide repeat protein [Bacteroidia bacterium]